MTASIEQYITALPDSPYPVAPYGAAVRNIAAAHLLDAIAVEFGETCYEVPVGFKHVSGKMLETGAVIGGESSVGLTVRGHVQGKDGIYAASLLVEMLATTVSNR